VAEPLIILVEVSWRIQNCVSRITRCLHDA